MSHARLNQRFPRLAMVVLLAVAPVLCGCAGYQIGNQSLYPSHIRTVYVPTFDTNSFRRNLGERLTEAVIKEIELKTPYKVVNTPAADSVLTAYLVSEGKHVVAEDAYDDPRQLEMNMKIEVNWIDRRGQMIGPGGTVPLPSEGEIVTGMADMTPEVGQSIASSQQQAIQRVAEQIVAMMEASW
ncbi:MAG: hypothetical protein JW888_05510 [Pirellulales bacterium]|nr:hypothetical protein [Pirellulales bacterium]